MRFTLIHSHGNAVDLGQMLPFYRDLARALKANLLGFDYRGYGCSGGSPAASATFQDISAVLQMLEESYGRQRGDVVLYGQSVGSGPTAWMAARTPGLAGVVLHSPFLSGLRVLKPNLKLWPAWADIFPSYKYAPKIQSRTLVLHGTQDDVIDIAHGHKLHALLKNPSGESVFGVSFAEYGYYRVFCFF